MSPTRKLALILKHRYGATLCAFLAAAAVTGLATVLFMWAFDSVLQHRLDFQRIGSWCWITTPVLFVVSVELIRRVAPYAAGTGIPQAIFAAQRMTPQTEKRLKPLVSSLTMIVKVAALMIALWAGASTGREGPSVHVATCVFLLVMLSFRRLTGIAVDLKSIVVAGAAAGLAAAFNTPLAGVTFAIEELTPDYFSGIKDFVLMSIIVAAIAAQALTGDYAYFGHLADSHSLGFWPICLIGIAGGFAGALFSSFILEGQKFFARFHAHPIGRYALPALFSLGLLAIVFTSANAAAVMGPGNEAAKELLNGRPLPGLFAFPLAKMGATLLTYWSGVAGGIFAPCLSIGATLGAGMAQSLGFAVAGAALVGMAAFLSGTIQAPMTAFVIIFEMTSDHHMLLPVMLASLLSFMTARLLGAKHLYKALSENYASVLETKPE